MVSTAGVGENSNEVVGTGLKESKLARDWSRAEIGVVGAGLDVDVGVRGALAGVDCNSNEGVDTGLSKSKLVKDLSRAEMGEVGMLAGEEAGVSARPCPSNSSGGVALFFVLNSVVVRAQLEAPKEENNGMNGDSSRLDNRKKQGKS